MFDLVIKNAQVVHPYDGVRVESIAVKGNTIAGIFSATDNLDAKRTIDATGLHLFPGLVDPHVHWGVYNPAVLDFTEDTKFAAQGGITTGITYFRTSDSYFKTLPPYKETAENTSMIDFAFHLGLLTSVQLDELEEYVKKFGITSFKFYMGYKGMEQSRYGSDRSLDDGFLIDMLSRINKISDQLTLCVHTENVDINKQITAQKKESIGNDLAGFEQSRPDFSETEAAIRTLYLAQIYGVKIYIVHLSSLRSAKTLETLPFYDPAKHTIETCPHYLTENVNCAAGLKAVVKPSLRSQEDAEGLWEYIRKGLITTIGSDNAPLFTAAKFAKGEDVVTDSIVPGFAEMGYTLPLLLSEGFHKRGIPLDVIAAITSTNPARAFGLYPRKGCVGVGSDADFVLVDLEKTKSIQASEWKKASDFSIYEGRQVKGWPVMTISRGEIIVDDGQVIGNPGRGKYLSRVV